MSHYVVSDIHGEADRFYAMLEQIGFTDQDTLYILGDVVDRGDWGVELLTLIRARKNMVMLLGNHEHMCLRYFSPDVTEQEIRRWNRNRNEPTKQGMLRLPKMEREGLLEWLTQLPTHLEVTVEGRRYYLVHGFPGQTLHDEVWGRPELNTPNPIPGSRVIIGHTPVSCVSRDDDQEQEYIASLEKQGKMLTILHTPGYIDLDCCCGYQIPIRRLSCLRLEDGAEFYC